MIDYSRLEQAIFDGITRALAADREIARAERAAMEQCQAKAKKTHRRCSRPAVPGKRFCEIHRFTNSESKNGLTESPYLND